MRPNGKQVTILAATLLCELGRADDPRIATSAVPLAFHEYPNGTNAFKHPPERELTLREADEILQRYFALPESI